MVRQALTRNQDKPLRFWILLLATAVCGTWSGATAAAAEPLRSEAALSMTFDESTGDAKVAVAGVSEALAAKLIGSPKRVPSPFWSQTGKGALLLDASKRQCVQLADIPYLDRPDAVTLSLFFLSLHPAADQNPHGILGKRSDGPRGQTTASTTSRPPTSFRCTSTTAADFTSPITAPAGHWDASARPSHGHTRGR